MRDHQSDETGKEPGRGNPAPRQPQRWRADYPAILGCLTEGRAPLRGEIETLAARMDREIGAGANAALGRAGAEDERRRLLIAAARAALLGRQCPECRSPKYPLALRGH